MFLPHLDKEALSKKALGECWSILGYQTSKVLKCTAAQHHALLALGLPLVGSFLVRFLKRIRSQCYEGFIKTPVHFGKLKFELFLFSSKAVTKGGGSCDSTIIVIFVFQIKQFSREYRKVFGSLRYDATRFSQNLAPLFDPIRSKTEANHDSLVHVFPRFVSGTCIYSEFWLVHWILSELCDWLEWLLSFRFYDTQLKTALFDSLAPQISVCLITVAKVIRTSMILKMINLPTINQSGGGSLSPSQSEWSRIASTW